MQYCVCVVAVQLSGKVDTVRGQQVTQIYVSLLYVNSRISTFQPTSMCCFHYLYVEYIFVIYLIVSHLTIILMTLTDL